MSDTDNDFWAVARRPRHSAQSHLQALYKPAPPEPDPAPDPIEAVPQMDQAQYAAARDEIMAEHAGGPRPSSDWAGGVDLPAPRAALTRDELVALGMAWRTNDRPGPSPARVASRPPDTLRLAGTHTGARPATPTTPPKEHDQDEHT
jgi:hypothetical protein